MLRRIVAALIFLSILYFPLGWLAVTRDWLAKDVYFSIAAIVGALASITSLLAFVRPRLTTSDLQNLEVESLERATSTAKQLEELEGKKSEAQSELEQLTRTKQEMALLVKKASRALFLREERGRLENTIVEKISNDSILEESLAKYREYGEQIQRLDEEVDAHPDADILHEIVLKAKAKKRDPIGEMIEAVEGIPVLGPILAALLKITRVFSESMAELLEIAFKR